MAEKVFPVGQHPYKDEQLINGKVLAERLGVTGAAISKAKSSGRISQYENSKGQKMFYEATAREEFFKNRDPSKVTTATNGQKAIGLTNLGARAIAQRRTGFVSEDRLDDAPMTDEEVFDFTASRARREKYSADMAKMKSDEMAGRLVDKELAGNKVKEIAASCKDRLLNIHLKVAVSVMPVLEKALVDAGFEEDGVRSALSLAKIEAVIGESVRKNVVESLRDIVKKEIDGFIG